MRGRATTPPRAGEIGADVVGAFVKGLGVEEAREAKEQRLASPGAAASERGALGDEEEGDLVIPIPEAGGEGLEERVVAVGETRGSAKGGGLAVQAVAGGGLDELDGAGFVERRAGLSGRESGAAGSAESRTWGTSRWSQSRVKTRRALSWKYPCRTTERKAGFAPWPWASQSRSARSISMSPRTSAPSMRRRASRKSGPGSRFQ